eukprot:GHVN01066818.1.p4 GENE.GHVN01066818.1~~GHVN01066818.1.p4  ORF type:complete len:322 (-),score=73.56 GHVN01066818.1:2987-3952(-)
MVEAWIPLPPKPSEKYGGVASDSSTFRLKHTLLLKAPYLPQALSGTVADALADQMEAENLVVREEESVEEQAERSKEREALLNEVGQERQTLAKLDEQARQILEGLGHSADEEDSVIAASLEKSAVEINAERRKSIHRLEELTGKVKAFDRGSYSFVEPAAPTEQAPADAKSNNTEEEAATKSGEESVKEAEPTEKAGGKTGETKPTTEVPPPTKSSPVDEPKFIQKDEGESNEQDPEDDTESDDASEEGEEGGPAEEESDPSTQAEDVSTTEEPVPDDGPADSDKIPNDAAKSAPSKDEPEKVSEEATEGDAGEHEEEEA